MVKRKVAITENDERFVWKAKLISTSTKKTIEVHDLLQLIGDESRKMEEISSPKFKLGGVDFSISVYPDDSDHDGSGFIGVYLNNHSDEDQTTSITVKLVSGVEKSLEMRVVKAGKGRGWNKFLSHQKYQKWAKDHGDVLKLEVMVTLHSKAEGGGWTR